MENCTIAYIGQDQIATNFYAMTEIQQMKRTILNVNAKYDILNIDRIKLITDTSDKPCISGINRRLDGNTFLFNYLIERGINIRKLIALNVDQSIHLETKLAANKEKDYSRLFDNESVIGQREQIVSELVLMALESLHNLYWKTGRTANWQQIHEEDKEKYNIIQDELKKKYNTTNLNELFVRKQGKAYAYQFEQADKDTYQKMKTSADRGFNTIIKAAASIQDGGHGVFLYYFETCNKDYWQLDNKEYYILNIHGLGYPLRCFGKKNVRDILKMGGVQSLSEFELRENRIRFIEKLYRTLQHFKTKNLEITGTTNKMVLDLVKPIYDISDDIHLYACENSHIELAIRKNVNLVELLKSLNKQIKELKVSDCFDDISIADAAIGPLGIHYSDTKNPMLIDLKYLDKIDKIEGNVNGCDKQQVLSLFNKLRE